MAFRGGTYTLRQAPVTSSFGQSTYGGSDPGTIDAKPFLDYMTQIKNLSLDPQGELRSREQQQLQQQTRAGLEARGLNQSGVGQGIESEVMSDFGIDWQDRLLGRAAQGAGAFTALGGQAQNIASTGFQQAGQLGSSAFQYGGGGGSTPAFTRTHVSKPAGSSLYSRPNYVPGQGRYGY